MDEFEIFGAEASFPTQKLLGIFRFKGIPMRLCPWTPQARAELRPRAGTDRIPIVRTPEDWVLHDTARIAQWMERLFPHAPLLPATPVQRAACLMLEDWVSAWWIRPALHLRWFSEPDSAQRSLDLARELAGLPRGPLDATDRMRLAADARELRDAGRRDAERRGAGAAQGGEMQLLFARWLELAGVLLVRQRYLLGDRPCLADYALYGAFEAHLAADPSAREIVERRAPALLSYTARLREARGDDELHLAAGWLPDDSVALDLLPLLEEMARDFHMHLRLNREALKRGEALVVGEAGFGPRALATSARDEVGRVVIARELARHTPRERRAMRAVLEPTGAWSVFELPPVLGTPGDAGS